jgi:hypothetical protein
MCGYTSLARSDLSRRQSASVCVCVCVREREREKERAGNACKREAVWLFGLR